MKNIVVNHNKLHYFFIKCEFHLYTVLKYLFSRDIARKKIWGNFTRKNEKICIEIYLFLLNTVEIKIKKSYNE